MLFRRFTLFRFFGFKIKADASWLFISVLITWTLSASVFPRIYPGHPADVYQFMGLAALAGLFVSIIAHEVAHAVIAEYYHMPIESITLFIFGGVAEMRGDPSHPKGEFFTAVSGPVMSAFMGLFFYAAGEFYLSYMAFGHENAVSKVLKWLGDLNLLIAAFNMIPAFPLDGGRALRAVIWHYKNNLVLATRIVSQTGYAFAYLLLGYACYEISFNNDVISGIWSGLLGLFTHGTAAYAVRQSESRSLLGTEKVSRFLQPNIVSVTPDITVSELVDGYIYKHYQKSFPVTDRGLLVGVIFLQSVLSLDRHKWPWLHVGSLMDPPGPDTVIGPDDPASEALERMQRLGRDSLVVASGRNLLGVIALRDLATYLSITMKVDQNKPVEKGRAAY